MRAIAAIASFLCSAAAPGLLAQTEQTSVPPKAQADYRQGMKYEESRQWQEAFYAFSGSVAAGESAPGWFHRGKAEVMLGRRPAAINDFTHAIHLSPQYVEAFRWRGEAYAAVGQPQEAIDDLTRVIDAGAPTSQVYAARAASYEHF